MIKLDNTITIFKKEMNSYFNSPVAYIVIVVFLGLLAWFFVKDIFYNNIASMRLMFEWAQIFYIFIIPALTMATFADEKRLGTIEILTTKPLHDIEIILGKFLSSWALIAIALAPTILYYISISTLGEIDHGATITGYIGLLLLSAEYIAVGIFASSLTQNQIVSFIIGLLILFFLYLAGTDVVLRFLPGFLGTPVQFMSSNYHFANIARGVLDTRDLIYFLSSIGFVFYLTTVSLERRKW